MNFMRKMFDKKIKKMNVHDIQLTKLSTAAFILFLLAVWPGAHDLAMSIHWGWYLAAFIIFALIPAKKVFF